MNHISVFAATPAAHHSHTDNANANDTDIRASENATLSSRAAFYGATRAFESRPLPTVLSLRQPPQQMTTTAAPTAQDIQRDAQAAALSSNAKNHSLVAPVRSNSEATPSNGAVVAAARAGLVGLPYTASYTRTNSRSPVKNTSANPARRADSFASASVKTTQSKRVPTPSRIQTPESTGHSPASSGAASLAHTCNPSLIAASLAASRARSQPPSPKGAKPVQQARVNDALLRIRPLDGTQSSDEYGEREQEHRLTTRQLINSFEQAQQLKTRPDGIPRRPSGGSHVAAAMAATSTSSDLRLSSSIKPIVSPIPIRPSIPLLASRRAFANSESMVEAKPVPPQLAKKPVSLARSLSYRPPKALRQTVDQSSLKAQPTGQGGGSPARAYFDSYNVFRPTTRDEMSDDSDASSAVSFLSAQDEVSEIEILKRVAATTKMTSEYPTLPRSQVRATKEPNLQSSSPGTQPSPSTAPTRTASLRPSYSQSTSRRPSSTLTLDLGYLKPQLTADSLADAIVASSLASSRVTSPTRRHLTGPYSPPSWTPKYTTPSQSSAAAASSAAQSIPVQFWPTLHPQHTGSSLRLAHTLNTPAVTRTPSPLKSFRQTLRRPSSPDSQSYGRWRSKSQDARSGRTHHKYHLRKHPHKHAEGDRRRWRDSVTEPERRRYEGVWAANRGILCDIAAATMPSGPSPGSEDVHAYVVRDIWQRSGLGSAVLAQIWDLVASADNSAGSSAAEKDADADANTQVEPRFLRKHEFVVGTWLVDQCLRGHRLPAEVGPSVWNSVRWLMPGIRAR